MSAHLRVLFSIGSSYDAEYALVDWHEPWHGQHVRVYHGIDPAYTERGKAESAQLVGYLVGYANTPMAAVRVYNAQLSANYAETKRKWPDYEAGEPPLLKGRAWYVSDGEDCGHFEFRDLATEGDPDEHE